MANQWFRLYAEFASDAKVQMLSESNQRRLLMLFCFRCNGDVTLQNEEVAFQLRISNDEWVTTKALFIAKGFINNDNKVLNWDKRQYKSDSSAERVSRHREKIKKECNVTVTPQNRTDTDTEQIQKKTNAKKVNFFADIPKSLVFDYLQVRKAKRAPPVSKTVYDGLVRESALAGITIEQAITICCERNWVGFKADWYIQQKPKTHDPTKPSRMDISNIDYSKDSENWGAQA